MFDLRTYSTEVGDVETSRMAVPPGSQFRSCQQVAGGVHSRTLIGGALWLNGLVERFPSTGTTACVHTHI